MTFPEFLREKRKQKRLSQAEMSKIIGASENYYGAIERGTYNPSWETMVKIAKALKIDLNFLKKFVGNNNIEL